MDRRITENQPEQGINDQMPSRSWWRSKVNLTLTGIAGLGAVGLAIACVGVFAFDSVTIAVTGAIMVSASALLWSGWVLAFIATVIIQKMRE